MSIDPTFDHADSMTATDADTLGMEPTLPPDVTAQPLNPPLAINILGSFRVRFTV